MRKTTNCSSPCDWQLSARTNASIRSRPRCLRAFRRSRRLPMPSRRMSSRMCARAGFSAQKRGTLCCARASSSQNTAAACRTRWRRSLPCPASGARRRTSSSAMCITSPPWSWTRTASGSQTGWDSSTDSRTPSKSRLRCARSCRRRNHLIFATGSSCTAAPCVPRVSRCAAHAACAKYAKLQRRWSHETDRTHPQ